MASQNFDDRQISLRGELEYRLEWYWQIRDKARKQLIFAPKSTRSLMSELIFYIDRTALPIVRKLIESIGFWSREEAQNFYQANQEVCRLTDLINYDATDEERQTWRNPRVY